MEDQSETEAEDKDENRNGYMPPHTLRCSERGRVPPSRSSNRLTRLPPRPPTRRRWDRPAPW